MMKKGQDVDGRLFSAVPFPFRVFVLEPNRNYAGFVTTLRKVRITDPTSQHPSPHPAPRNALIIFENRQWVILFPISIGFN
jgi:hypothetical protein